MGDIFLPALGELQSRANSSVGAEPANLILHELTAQVHGRLNSHETRARLSLVVRRNHGRRGLSIGTRGRDLPKMLTFQLDGAATRHNVARLTGVHAPSIKHRACRRGQRGSP